MKNTIFSFFFFHVQAEEGYLRINMATAILK